MKALAEDVPNETETTERDRERRVTEALKLQGTTFLATGAGVAVIGLAGVAVGAVCPLCVIAAPAVAGLGLVQRLRAWHRQSK